MISKATITDTLMIAQMAIKIWTKHSLDELVKEFEEIIEQEESVIFLFSIDYQVAGFAQCQIRHDYVEGTNISPVGYLEGIFVEKEFRHNGYAKELLERCQYWAKEKGCAEFASDCELDNKESLAFHLNMEFEEVNRIICFTKRL